LKIEKANINRIAYNSVYFWNAIFCHVYNKRSSPISDKPLQ